jgi:hypothetical protein
MVSACSYQLILQTYSVVVIVGTLVLESKEILKLGSVMTKKLAVIE